MTNRPAVLESRHMGAGAGTGARRFLPSLGPTLASERERPGRLLSVDLCPRLRGGRLRAQRKGVCEGEQSSNWTLRSSHSAGKEACAW